MAESAQFGFEHLKILNGLNDEALENVDERYGNGFPDFSHEAPHTLRYHNGHHARAVSRGAVALGAALGFSVFESAVARASGSAHDIVQLKGRSQDEAESAAWLAEKLQQRHIFPQEAIALGSIAILGTEPLFDNGVLIGQKASLLEYPSKSAERIAKSVASADLGELHTPQGPYLGHELYREIKGYNTDRLPPIDGNLVAFQENQVILTRNYQYPLAEANTVLATHRAEVEAYAARTLTQLERGEVHSWEQLIAHDKKFLTQHT